MPTLEWQCSCKTWNPEIQKRCGSCGVGRTSKAKVRAVPAEGEEVQSYVASLASVASAVPAKPYGFLRALVPFFAASGFIEALASIILLVMLIADAATANRFNFEKFIVPFAIYLGMLANAVMFLGFSQAAQVLLVLEERSRG